MTADQANQATGEHKSVNTTRAVNIDQRKAVLDRETRAVQLATAGLTLEQISTEMRLGGRSAAHRMVRRALSRDHHAAVDEFRDVSMARLEAAHRAIWPAVLRGDAAAVAVFIRLNESARKLVGADAPVKAEVSGDGSIAVLFSAALAPQPALEIEP